MAHLVKGLTVDFGSGHDLMVVRLSPVLGSVLGVEPASDSLSPSSSVPTPLVFSPHVSLSLSLSQNKN